MIAQEQYRVIGENENGGVDIPFPTKEQAISYIEAVKDQFIGDLILQKISLHIETIDYLEEENA